MAGPLSQITVLDFSTLLPGPYATMLLADMGAEVVRIESPKRPDLLRITPPMQGDMSYAHLMINRNKRSVGLDLKHPDAHEVIGKLVKEVDVVVEQFRPGVMQRLGLDYATLKEINPKLIYCSITGYGQTGPMKDKAGHDINYLALSGIASYSGTQETGPVLSGTQIADIAGGSHHAVMAILGAVIERGTTGKGQYLDISMSDAAFTLNTMFGAASLATGEDADLSNNLLNGGGFYGYYQTADGRYLSVGSLEPQFAKAFFEALGHPQWLAMAALPARQQDELKTLIARVIANESLEHWLSVFSKLDACVEGVLSINEAALHPQFVARDMTVEVETLSGERIKQVAPSIKFESSDMAYFAGRSIGADSVVTLVEAGLSEAQVRELIEKGLVWQAPELTKV